MGLTGRIENYQARVSPDPYMLNRHYEEVILSLRRILRSPTFLNYPCQDDAVQHLDKQGFQLILVGDNSYNVYKKTIDPHNPHALEGMWVAKIHITRS